ncbi:MAG: hypothetical protein WCQ53_05470 [bacterium]
MKYSRVLFILGSMVLTFNLKAQTYTFNDIPAGYMRMQVAAGENSPFSIPETELVTNAYDSKGRLCYSRYFDEINNQDRLVQYGYNGEILNEIVISPPNGPAVKAREFNSKGFLKRVLNFNKKGQVGSITYYDSIGIGVLRTEILNSADQEKETRRFASEFNFKYAGLELDVGNQITEELAKGNVSPDNFDFLVDQDGPIQRMLEKAADRYTVCDERAILIQRIISCVEQLSLKVDINKNVELSLIMLEVDKLQKMQVSDEKIVRVSKLKMALSAYLKDAGDEDMAFEDMETMVDAVVADIVRSSKPNITDKAADLLYGEPKLMEYIVAQANDTPNENEYKSEYLDRASLLQSLVLDPDNMEKIVLMGLCDAGEITKLETYDFIDTMHGIYVNKPENEAKLPFYKKGIIGKVFSGKMSVVK